MKKLNLLLATTAILSTTALAANAVLTWDNYSNTGIEIPIDVKIVDPIKVAVERGINFGTIDYEPSKGMIKIDKDGDITGSAQYFGGAHTGLVWYKASTVDSKNATFKLVFPSEPVTLYHSDDPSNDCGTVNSFEQKLGSPNSDNEYPIYIGAQYNGNRVPAINYDGTPCTGTLTATLLYYNE